MNYFYLAHHGIQGQKWGVRNGPPYPLGSSSNTSSKQSNEHHQLSKNSDTKNKGKSFVEKFMKNRNIYGDTEDDAISYALSIAALAALMGIAAYRNKKAEDKTKQEFKTEILKRSKSYKNLNEVPKLEEIKTPLENSKQTNPDYPQSGTTQNCVLCTAAMAMREKGYDVHAGKISHGTYPPDVFSIGFKDPKGNKIDATTIKSKKWYRGAPTKGEVFSELSKYGDGSYGHLGVRWWYGGGHSVFWKNENGRIRIYDGQSGEEYKTNGRLFESIQMDQITYIRLDNLEPTDNVLKIVE